MRRLTLTLVAVLMVAIPLQTAPAEAHIIRPIDPSVCQIKADAAHGPDLVRCIARYFGVDGDRAVRTVNCETGGTWNPAIVSSSGTYVGWWQYSYSTWVEDVTPGRDGEDFLGWAKHGYSRKNGRQETIAATRHVYHYGWGAWPHCGYV